MIYVVTCIKNRSIKLPQGVECSVGDKLPCPAGCDGKKFMCAATAEFTVKAVRQKDDTAAARIFGTQYGEDEIGKIFGGMSPVEPVTKTEPVQNESSIGCDGYDAGGSDYDIDVPARDYGIPLSEPEILEADSDITEFKIPGIPPKVYSESKKIGALPLKSALNELFKYWETALVFKNDRELRREFVWLLVKTSPTKIEKSQVGEILKNENYNRSQKFFYLFYDVVFKYDAPARFYWCDDRLSLSPLTPHFTDKHDFMKRYCDSKPAGKIFREFYAERKREILHYLHCIDEEKLFEDLTVTLARDDKEIILLDTLNGYTPVRLGTTNEFIKNMQVPTDSSKMKNMCAFLEKFRVSRTGVFKRSPLDIFERKEYKEENSVYEAAGLSCSASFYTDYNNYCALLKEYIKVFTPTEVKVGKLRFTVADFYSQVEDAAHAFLKAQFGDATEAVTEYKGNAFLIKSFCDREVLKPFADGCENNKLEQLLTLIGKPDINEYFRLIPHPTFLFDGDEITVGEYIGGILYDELPAVCARFKDDIRVNAFFGSRAVSLETDKLDKILDEYQKQYREFENNL